jgi:site-specific DNA-cytosine methylase
MSKKKTVETYPNSLKDFESPVLKKDGTPFKWGTIIPLIGGMSMGSSIATQKKPDFLLTYTPFMGNEQHLTKYWPDVPYHNLDEFLNGENKKNLEDLKDLFEGVDFMNAVCPCAGLSMLNASTKGKSAMSRGSDAEQNKWMVNSTRFVLEHIKPKVLWGENAPALFTLTGEGVANKLKEIGEEFGYSFSMIKTSTFFHGIPQRRDRTFYFLWKAETAPYLNYYLGEQTKPLYDYIKEVPMNIEHSQDVNTDIFKNYPSYKFILEKEGISHKEFVQREKKMTLHGYLLYKNLIDEAIQWITENHGADCGEIKDLLHVKKKVADDKGWWDASPHIFYDKINAVVARNMWCSLHPEEQRYYSVRELLWLMGHPHDFNFVRDEKGRYNTNALAQNVPVPTARDWCKEVMKFVDGDLIMSPEKFLKQDNHKPIKIPTARKLF